VIYGYDVVSSDSLFRPTCAAGEDSAGNIERCIKYPDLVAHGCNMTRVSDNHPQIDICLELCDAPGICCDPHIVQQLSGIRTPTG